MSNKKVLITGGTGLIGTELVDRLIKEGFTISALCRNKKPGLNSRVNWVEVDFNDMGIDLRGLIGNSDILIHNAAVKSEKTNEEIKEMQSFNFDFTERLFIDAAKQGIKKIIFSSGFNIIARPLPEIITEASALNPCSLYARSKYFAEQQIQQLSARYGFSFNILRISSPVSFNLELLPSTVVKMWITRSLKGEDLQVFGKGTRTQDFIAVTDIAHAFVNCIQQENVSGIFNIAAGNSISMLELAKMITAKFSNRFELQGEDINENDRWNISIEKAQKQLKFTPQYDSRQTVTALLNNIRQ